jgi:MSHA biogenesis protein MshM
MLRLPTFATDVSHASDLLPTMYLSHFGLNEPPFRITPHTEFFFDGANRGATLEALLYAIEHDEGIVKVTGEVGSGKTMLCRVLIERLPKTVETIYLATPSLSRDEIVRALCEDLKVDARGKRTTLLLRTLQEHLIERYAAARRVVVLIDEAHAMPPETLEEIRLLSNLESKTRKLLQIVMFGQPELDDNLNMNNMRQLKERITHSFKLEPLVRSDIDSYVDFRMRHAGYRGRNAFSASALRLIANTSEGLTRRVNILADKSLLAAFADGSHEVTAKHARAAIKDSEYRRIGGGRARSIGTTLAVVGVVAGIALGAAAMYWWRAGNTVPATASPVTAPAAVAAKATGPIPVPPSPAPIAPSAPTTPPDAPAPPAADAGLRPVLPPVPPLPPVSAATPLSATSPAPAATAAELARAPRPEHKLSHERFVAGQTSLRTASPDRFTVQLVTAPDTDAVWMEFFLQRATELLGAAELYVYSWRVNGRQNYLVAVGNYESLQQASDAIAKLPAPLKQYKPYPESIAMMRRHNAQD